jgi:hypothetical protein
MLTRREAVTAGVMASVGGVAGNVSEAGAAPQDSSGVITVEMTQTLGAIRDELAALRRQMESSQMPTSPGITRLRQQLRQFLKGNTKFPDFVEVGAGVWDELIDWHVTTQRPLNIVLRGDGRYSMPFLQSVVILRVDYLDEQVGVPFDTRPA